MYVCFHFVWRTLNCIYLTKVLSPITISKMVRGDQFSLRVHACHLESSSPYKQMLWLSTKNEGNTPTLRLSPRILSYNILAPANATTQATAHKLASSHKGQHGFNDLTHHGLCTFPAANSRQMAMSATLGPFQNIQEQCVKL